MDEGAVGIAILVAIILVASIGFHWRSRRLIRASVTAAVVSAATFLMVDTVHRGYLDAFAPIAFVVSLFWALIGSFVVGLVFNVVRRSNNDVT
jgi:Zn-dependent protease with chaperone function